MSNDIIKNTLSINEQIRHLQKRGITFDCTNIESARSFLLYSNYVYKLYSYRKNFNTKVDPYDSNNRVYVGLDFFMLVDLSKFDRDIRFTQFYVCCIYLISFAAKKVKLDSIKNFIIYFI